jgi:hypothetical protein
MEQADALVWLDPPWPAAIWRIVLRHVKAEMKRNNRYPGWRRLARFVRSSVRYYTRDAGDARNGIERLGWCRAALVSCAPRLGTRVLHVRRAAASDVLRFLETAARERRAVP